MALGRLSSPCFQNKHAYCPGAKRPAGNRLSLRTYATERPRSAEPFNEGVVSVRRLIDRDKKEFLNNAGVSGDIMEKFVTEFGVGDSQEEGGRPTQPLPGMANPFATPESSAGTSSPAASTSTSSISSTTPTVPRPAAVVPREISASTPNPFKSSAASPFGSGAASAPKPFRSAIEPAGLSPDMSPDAFDKDKDTFNIMSLLNSSSLILVFSFGTIIGLMLATFWVVYNAGGISIAGVD